MSDIENGSIVWTDLTVTNASEVKDFYTEVLMCKSEAASMGDYEDYVLSLSDSGQGIAGVCHARGSNADIPSQWLPYFKISDLDQSLDKVKKLGGKTLSSIKSYGDDNRYAVIQDPAGAVCALFEAK